MGSTRNSDKLAGFIADRLDSIRGQRGGPDNVRPDDSKPYRTMADGNVIMVTTGPGAGGLTPGTKYEILVMQVDKFGQAHTLLEKLAAETGESEHGRHEVPAIVDPTRPISPFGE